MSPRPRALRRLKRLKRKSALIWKVWKIKLIALSFYLIPSEKQRLFVLTLVIGLLCGLAAVLFHLSIQIVEGFLIIPAVELPGRWQIVAGLGVPIIGGLVCGILLKYVYPDARGSGVPQVKIAYSIKGGRIPLRDAFSKFVISTLQIGSGASLGREGPTVQICSAISSSLGRLFAVSQKNQKKLIPVGTAAGIAAAFNAPIAAITFTIEEVIGDLDKTVLSGVIVAAAIAAAVERGIMGEHPVLVIDQDYGLDSASSLIFYAGLGIVAALVSVVFTESLLSLRNLFRGRWKIPLAIRPAVGGIVTGILILLAFNWLGSRGIAGSGYETLSSALSGSLALKTLLLLCVFKLAATVFCYSSGGAGGIFAPALFIGGMLGGVIGSVEVGIFGHPVSEIGSFALVGMGAVFAGIIRAPITSVLIIFEMTGSYGLILPLMIANMTSYGAARMFRSNSIYEALLEQDGIYLPDKETRAEHALEVLTVSEAMNLEIKTLREGMTVVEALESISQHNFTVYPVIADGNRCIGLVSEVRLRRILAEGGATKRLSSTVESFASITPEKNLGAAVSRMNELGVRRLVVVSKTGTSFLGLITMADVVKAEAATILLEKGERTGSVPDIHESQLGSI